MIKIGTHRRSTAHPAVAGFGLVETMVALVIGLLATFIIMQIFASSEGQKRTITGEAAAQTDAAVVLYLIERDLRQAGYGLSPNVEDFGANPWCGATGLGALKCGILAQCTNVRAYHKKWTAGQDFVYDQDTFGAVVINPPGYPAADANTDIILINYSSTGGMIGRGILLTDQKDPTVQDGGDVPDYRVNTRDDSRAGFMQGDMIVAVPPSTANPPDCTIGEITGLPVKDPTACQCAALCVTGDTDLINHNDVDYSSVYAGCTKVNAVWNKAGATYDAGSKLYNLGPVGAFVSRVYAVRNGNLTMCDLTVNNCKAAITDPPDGTWAPIAAGVVGLKAQYGKDTNFDGLVNTWQDATRPAGAARAQVIAVRLAVAVRSGQYEKEEVTAAAPVRHKDATGSDTASADVSINVSASSDDWKHYRYKTAQSVVPLRNMIWGQQLQ